jgi:4'-phosphopantetheinyl transferase
MQLNGPLVWLFDGRGISDAELAGFTSWLGPGEMARYRSFLRPQRRRQFLIGHVLLRQALATLFALPVRELVLEQDSASAPRLAGQPQAGISLSHSGPWVGCAVARATGLGFDIEMRDSGRDLAALAQQAFDADELAKLARGSHDFYQLWCAREARIKLQAPVRHAVDLAHPELAIALCAAAPLAHYVDIQIIDKL